ncbi:MAG: cation transporter [Firmicutes bacterium]|nr:cation transporter [Bacillota bacterium]
MQKNSGERTLIASALLSSPGPLILGVALFFGRSATQLADFVRRSAELGAIIVSLIVFRILNKDSNPSVEQKNRLEYLANFCVGTAMCLSGLAMLLISIFSISKEKGNVIPALIIAVLGVITNTWFWLRYRKLNRLNPNGIFAVQSRLYMAKSAVDICVTTALTAIILAPAAPATKYLDLGGSIIIAVYLLVTGATIIRKKQPQTILSPNINEFEP